VKRKYYVWPLASIFALTMAVGQVVPGRYIIELRGEPAAIDSVKSGRRQSMTERRNTVRTQQRQLRATIEQADTKIVDTTDTVANTLLVQMPATRVSELASNPGVARIHQVKMYKLALDHAVGVQKVTDAWAQIGGMANAGAGIKIGIIDTGIDVSHPGFQDSSLPALDGFPKVNASSDQRFTNNKIIVARSYDNTTARGSSADDRKGHGTAVAMIAAGVTNAGPLGTITGIAPKAYLGNYKVFPDSTDGAPSDEILKALDDAVADGMDVVNMSLGSQPADRPAGDILVQAVEKATAAGVVVVIAAGNEGPDLHSIASPGTAPSAITVGNSYNDRIFAAKVTLDGAPQAYESIPGSGPSPSSAIAATVADVSTLDSTGLACAALPAGSLTGKVALILRGTCYFEDKLNNAQNAGALAALVYTTPAQPDPIPMSAGAATLPASMVSNADGLDIKNRVAQNQSLKLTLYFDQSSFPVSSSRIDDSSSRGPSADDSLKPDLLAVGSNVYTASPTSLGTGGYTVASGTSLSAPMVTGAAALLKAARPGLTAAQYRSLLINTSHTFSTDGVNPAPVEAEGAGLLDASASLRGTVSAYPTALGFGIGGATVDATKTVTLTNLGATADTFSISAMPIGDGPVPAVSDSAVQLEPGRSKDITVRLQGSGLNAGQYQGFLVVRGTQSDVDTKLPFWYGVPSQVATSITLFDPPTTGRRSTTQTIYFRPLDAVGIPTTVSPTVTVVSGGGTVIGTQSLDEDTPGLYAVQVRLGLSRGDNVFEIQVGSASETITITGR
jgi:minor extracellular serine protease Vpr